LIGSLPGTISLRLICGGGKPAVPQACLAGADATGHAHALAICDGPHDPQKPPRYTDAQDAR
jgi:hypothetical protein